MSTMPITITADDFTAQVMERSDGTGAYRLLDTQTGVKLAEGLDFSPGAAAAAAWERIELHRLIRSGLLV